MELIDKAALIEGRVCNDPVVIAANCAPLIDAVEVRHAYWEYRYDGAYSRRRAYCSDCGKHSGIGGIISNQEKPFCPNCGAKMDGRRESEGT